MTVVNDCSDPDILEKAHELAVLEAERELTDLLDSVRGDADILSSALTELTDDLLTMMAPMGVDPRQDSCFLPNPNAPTVDDISNALSAQTGFLVINGEVFLPGPLDLTAIKRLLSLFGTITKVYDLIPEMFPPKVADPLFNIQTVEPRLLVVEVDYKTTSVADNLCNPEDVVETTEEYVVSVNKPLSGSDTSIAVVVWIGEPTLNQNLRRFLAGLNFSDEEIAAVVLGKSSPLVEVYQIIDPPRLGRYMMKFGAIDEPDENDLIQEFIQSILVDPRLTSVDDTQTQADVNSAIRDLLTTPPQFGCGVPVAMALTSCLSFGSADTGDTSNCDSAFDRFARRVDDKFGKANKIFGPLGVVQKAIARIIGKFQSWLAATTFQLHQVVSIVERYVLSLATYSVSLGQYSASTPYTAAQAGLSSSYNQYARIPEAPDVAEDRIATWADMLGQQKDRAQTLINTVTRAMMGVSLLACSATAFGGQSTMLPPGLRGRSFGLGLGSAAALTGLREGGSFRSRLGSVRDNFMQLEQCEQERLQIQLDLHSINFDLMNQLMQQLNDLILRLRTVLDALGRGISSPVSAMSLNCSMTETTQLAVSVSQQIAAGNFGQFNLRRRTDEDEDS